MTPVSTLLPQAHAFPPTADGVLLIEPHSPPVLLLTRGLFAVATGQTIFKQWSKDPLLTYNRLRAEVESIGT